MHIMPVQSVSQPLFPGIQLTGDTNHTSIVSEAIVFSGDVANVSIDTHYVKVSWPRDRSALFTADSTAEGLRRRFAAGGPINLYPSPLWLSADISVWVTSWNRALLLHLNVGLD